jgi:hypothetical protein
MNRNLIRGIAVGSLLAMLAAAPSFAQKDKNAPQTRTLTGAVMNKGDQPLQKALVYLKNTKTLTVQTFITGPDGKFRFNSLSPNVDYDVFAEYSGKRSNTRTLSSFDTRADAFMPLTIDVQK